MKKVVLFFCLLPFFLYNAFTQSTPQAELVMSMSQRSLVMPGYLDNLKALIARQAYNFWVDGASEPYVSHLNIYAALHYANKYISYDSTNMVAYNQVGFHNNKVTDITFGSNPNYYYSASADGTILKWNLSNPKEIPQIIFESDKIIKSIDISDDGSVLMAVFYQTGLVLIPLNQVPGKDIQTIEDPEPIQTAVFIPNEQKYLSVTRKGELKIKGYKSSEVQQVGQTSLKVNELTVDKNDGTIYAGTNDGTLEAWEKPYEVEDNNLNEIIDELGDKSYFGYKLGSFAINCMDLSPDGHSIALGRERGDVILWNIKEKKIQRVISGHQSAITAIDFSPDNRLLLTTSRDKTARIWDVNDSRKLPIILDDHQDWVFSGSFDPSGRMVITGSGDQFLRTWPVDHKDLADRLCKFLDKNMTNEEWEEFVGKNIPYEETCK